LIIMFFFSLFGLLLPTETKDNRPNI
jgi:hypothetical protein